MKDDNGYGYASHGYGFGNERQAGLGQVVTLTPGITGPVPQPVAPQRILGMSPVQLGLLAVGAYLLLAPKRRR